jgi:hypothetical protein
LGAALWSAATGFELMPVKQATMRVRLIFFARGLVTLLFFVANVKVTLLACWNTDEFHS